MEQPILSPLFSREKKYLPDAAIGNAHEEMDDTFAHELPAIHIDHLPTRADIKAMHKPSPTLLMVNGLPFDEEPTWIIPVIRAPKSAPKLEAGDSGTEVYVSLLRNLMKSSGIYALSTLASPLISLVLAPFLTHTLSHTDYGVLAVLNTIVALVAGVTQFGLYSAFFRTYSYDYESERDRLGVLSTVVVLLLSASIPVTITVMISAGWLAEVLFARPSLEIPMRLAALVILLQNLTVPGFAWLRAENRAIFFSTLSIANLLVALGATIALVGVLHMGIAGSLIATGSGYAVVVVCTLPLILLRAGVRPRFDIAWGLLTFGLPNVTNFVSVWVLQLSDRYLLSRFGSLAQTASYAIAYSLGGVLSVVVISPFSLAWPSTMFSIAKRDDATHIFRLVFRWFSIVLLFAAYGLSLVSRGVLDLFFPPSYLSAAPVIPIVTASIMFYGVYLVFTTGVSVKRKTWLSVIFTTVSALTNVGFNLILIPNYGSIGAAVSTLIAYALLALIAYVVNQWIYPIPFEIGPFIIVLFVGIALYVGSSLLAQHQGTFGAWGIYICTFVLYGGCLAFVGILPTWSHRDRRRTKEDSVL